MALPRMIPRQNTSIEAANRLDAKHITVSRILNESNVETRRVMINRYGIERFVRDVGGVNGSTKVKVEKRGTLYTTRVEGDEPIVLIRVRNSTPEPDGSIKEYFLRIPPNIRSVDEGLAWGFGLKPGEYDPLKET